MKIFLVEDDADIRGLLVEALLSDGHEPTAFVHPRELLEALNERVDLVIAEVDLEEMDGITLADKVAERLGVAPPRTLLLSLRHRQIEEETAPYKSVLGALPKPFRIAQLERILGLLASCRAVCPCRIKGLISVPAIRHKLEAENQDMLQRYCNSADYSSCPDYDSVCGKRLRRWIEKDRS